MAGTFTEAKRGLVQIEIIAVAERIFAKRGIAATSMGHIAEEVGIGRPALYHYFPSKEVLVSATIQSAVDRYESFAEISDVTPFDEAVTSFITRLVRNIASTDEAPLRFFFTILLEQFEDPLNRQPVRAIIDSYRREVAELIRLGKSRGEVSPSVDASLIADRLTGQIIGMQWMWLLYPAQIDLEGIAARTEREFLSSMSE